MTNDTDTAADWATLAEFEAAGYDIRTTDHPTYLSQMGRLAPGANLAMLHCPCCCCPLVTVIYIDDHQPRYGFACYKHNRPILWPTDVLVSSRSDVPAVPAMRSTHKNIAAAAGWEVRSE